MGFQCCKVANGKVYGSGVYLSSDVEFSIRDYAFDNRAQRGRGFVLLCDVIVGQKKGTFSNFTMFTDKHTRTGGSLEKGYEHIYLKPFVYVNSDIAIRYVMELDSM